MSLLQGTHLHMVGFGSPDREPEGTGNRHQAVRAQIFVSIPSVPEGSDLRYNPPCIEAVCHSIDIHHTSANRSPSSNGVIGWSPILLQVEAPHANE